MFMLNLSSSCKLCLGPHFVLLSFFVGGSYESVLDLQGLVSFFFLLLGRLKEREKGYQESTETEPKNQEIEVGFVIIFIVFRVSYYCRAFHLTM